MSEVRKLSRTTLDFLDKTSELVGRIEAEEWNQNTFCELVEGEIQSPIEELFYIAVKAMCRAAYVTVNPEPFQRKNGEWDNYPGIFVIPQFQVGKYRVDFKLVQHNLAPGDIYGPLVVELDGHEFHDKDKRQRSYEKARDRFLTRQGFKVLHFTGSDVVKDPFKVAHECLDMLGALVGSGIYGEYNQLNPLGID